MVGHGSERDGGANASLVAHADALRRRGVFADVRAVALFGAPSPAVAVAGLRGREAVVLPFLMCDGAVARRRVPAAFGLDRAISERAGRRWVICPPAGLHPGLNDLVLARAWGMARVHGWEPATATLLLIGHGSPHDPASRRATRWHARRCRRTGPFARIAVAFLDEPPFLASVAESLTGPAVAVGLFAAAGRHAAGDTPRILETQAPVPVAYAGAIGEDPAVADVLLTAAREARTAVPAWDLTH